jgi:pSer/pThr/pTyr-binding forkhead associated (FHA) protein
MTSDDQRDVLWVRHGRRCLELRPGRVVVGRALDADFVINNAQVSRRHAEIQVSDGRAVLVDLGSSNGVIVNGQRVSASRPLASGDEIVIGGEALEFHVTPAAEFHVRARELSQLPDTLTEAERAAVTAPPPSEITQTARALGLLGSAAEKSMALGRGEEAERMLNQHLSALLKGARGGALVPSESAAAAAGLAIGLAESTRRGRWIDYVFDLYSSLERPLEERLIERLYGVVRGVSAIDAEALRSYLALLRRRHGALQPSERFALQRLEGLARMLLPPTSRQ